MIPGYPDMPSPIITFGYVMVALLGLYYRDNSCQSHLILRSRPGLL